MTARLRAILFVLALGLAGCAPHSGPPTSDTLAIPAARYPAAFDAARRTLRDQGFILERVDAQAGVITTRPKTTAGLATPWHGEQSTASQEIEDLLQRQERVVRITFEPVTASVTVATDLRATTAPLRMSTQVTLYRLHTPGNKLEPDAIQQSSYYYDPALGARGMQPAYAVAIRQDELLAERLNRLIGQGLADASPEPEWTRPTPVNP